MILVEEKLERLADIALDKAPACSKCKFYKINCEVRDDEPEKVYPGSFFNKLLINHMVVALEALGEMDGLSGDEQWEKILEALQIATKGFEDMLPKDCPMFQIGNLTLASPQNLEELEEDEPLHIEVYYNKLELGDKKDKDTK